MKFLGMFCLFLSLATVSGYADPVTAVPGPDANIFCNAYTRTPYEVEGDRCRYRDEVMVGIASVQPLKIRCARLYVSCFENRNSLSDSERR